MSQYYSLSEQMILRNENEKTAKLAGFVGEYLQNTWNICSLTLTVDGVEYSSTKSKIWKNTRLYKACGRLAEAKSIAYTLVVCGMDCEPTPCRYYIEQIQKDDPVLRPNLVFRAAELSDDNEDRMPDLTLYDENGFHQPEFIEYPAGGTDVKTWFSDTALLMVGSDTHKDDLAMRDRIDAAYRRFCDVAVPDKECMCVTDDWQECGNYICEASVEFSAEEIPEVLQSLQEIADLAGEMEDARLYLQLNAIPCGEDDPLFAVLSFDEESGKVGCRYCRF